MPQDLGSIRAEIIGQINKLKKEAEDINVLFKVDILLEKGEIEKAILYLQRIVEDGFITKTPIIKKLEGRVLEDKSQTVDNTPVLVKDLTPFIKLHSALVSLSPNPPRWFFSYPKDKSGQVMNDVIEKWQNSLSLIIQDQTSLVDYFRGITIESQNAKDEEDARALIKKFVDKSKYTEEQKEKLIRWFEHNGGQVMHTFLADSFKALHFYGKPNKEDANDVPGFKTQKIASNWYLHDGKFYFYDDLLLKTITYNNGRGIIAEKEIKQKDKTVKQIAELDNLKDEKDFDRVAGARDNDFDQLLPVMGVKAEVRLDFEDGEIVPKLLDYKVTSYTNILHPPSRQQLELTSKSGKEEKVQMNMSGK